MNHLVAIQESVFKLRSVTLKEMERASLMNRVDTKYLLALDSLPNLLELSASDFFVLEILGERMMKYSTLYYDTPERKMYQLHHNGKLNRYKIRRRKYVESEIQFLEVKFKNNKGRTKKSRISSEEMSNFILDSEESFVEQSTPFFVRQLKPVLNNSFTRITLLHKRDAERITIDFSLQFQDEELGKVKQIDSLAIVEVKQEGFHPLSQMIRNLKKLGAKQSSFSKYCIGSSLVNSQLKKNRFKETLLTTKRLENLNKEIL